MFMFRQTLAIENTSHEIRDTVTTRIYNRKNLVPLYWYAADGQYLYIHKSKPYKFFEQRPPRIPLEHFLNYRILRLPGKSRFFWLDLKYDVVAIACASRFHNSLGQLIEGVEQSQQIGTTTLSLKMLPSQADRLGEYLQGKGILAYSAENRSPEQVQFYQKLNRFLEGVAGDYSILEAYRAQIIAYVLFLLVGCIAIAAIGIFNPHPTQSATDVTAIVFKVFSPFLLALALMYYCLLPYRVELSTAGISLKYLKSSYEVRAADIVSLEISQVRSITSIEISTLDGKGNSFTVPNKMLGKLHGLSKLYRYSRGRKSL
ncbi:MAG: hypothetical protein WA885_15800 [Phormidesmis sp.]